MCVEWEGNLRNISILISLKHTIYVATLLTMFNSKQAAFTCAEYAYELPVSPAQALPSQALLSKGAGLATGDNNVRKSA